MDDRTRNVVIVLVVVVALMGCCVLVAAVAAVGFFVPVQRVAREVTLIEEAVSVRESESEAWSFEVGEAPELEVDNFAGSITVRTGEGDTIQVTAIKKVPANLGAEQIEVTMSEGDRGVVVTSRNPRRLNNASVELQIIVPPNTRLDLDTGAGGIDVHGVRGEVRLDTGAGSVEYEGEPLGDCAFETGAGSITLKLPEDLNAEVDLSTGVGSIEVEYDVAGQVSAWEVEGLIGDGSEASISAHTGAGAIEVVRR